MNANLERLKTVAPDLRNGFPRSPRETLGGYVVAARTLDKCRAHLARTLGEYVYNCPLDRLFFEFSGIDSDAFAAFVGTGAPDEEVGRWVREHARQRERIEVVRWNNDLRYRRISELPDALQEYLEDYLPTVVPPGKHVYVWFDVYDIEEQRM